MTEQILTDVKVLDLTWYISGPYCTKILADYGADVIKVERPGTGDPARRMGPFLGDDPHPEKSLLFSHLNLNKKGITLDLKSEKGRKTIKELVREMDILVESFSPGVMDRLGLDYQTLKRIHPRLIMTAISNYGQTGPYRDYKSSELILNGFHSMINNGLPDRHPLKKGGNACLYQGGLIAALATLGALWASEEHGIGQYIDVSLMETQTGDADRKNVDLLAWAYSGNAIYTMRPGADEWRGRHIMPSGIFPCKDGFVSSRPILAHWPRFVELMKRPELEKIRFPDDMFDMDMKGEIEVMWLEWLAERTKREAMEECQGEKWFVTSLNTPRDAVEDPHFKEHGFWVEVEHPVTGKQTYPGAPIGIGEGSWQVRRPAPLLGQHNREIFGEESGYAKGPATGSRLQGSFAESDCGIHKLPLEGIRIVDLSVVFAGPFATWLLACLGAEVIHVDSIHHRPDMGRSITLRPTKEMIEGKDGDRYPNRDPGDHPWNRGAFFNRMGWNKRSCCINLKDPLGKDIFKRLISASDLFIENNSASAMDHLGLGPEVLMEANPRLICINMPSYGRTGPYSNYVGWGDNAESLTGHGWVRGYDDAGHPVHNTPMFHMDSTGGAMAAIGAILALRRRKRTGKGVAIDFAQIESMIPQLGEIYMDFTWNARNQRTMGNRHPTSVQGCYRCRGEDRWINITISNDEEWQGLCHAMGNPPWTGEAGFSDQTKRHENHDALDRSIEDWTIRYDNFELFNILQHYGVPAGPVYTEKDTYNDPHLNARGFFEIIHQEETGTYRYPGFLWKMSDTPLSVRYPPPLMGEDNDYVFRDVIKLSDEEISELTEKKIIGGDFYIWI